MLYLLIVVVFITVAIYLFMRQPQFGSLPKGERMKRMQQSIHFKNGSFQNIHDTPQLTEGTSYGKLLREFFFNKNPGRKPAAPIPSIKTDLLSLDPEKNLLIWFGHSSYFMQLDGKKFLVDPVLSGSASPLPGGTKAFAGSDIFRAADIPPVDYLLITHDHWDHLDYKTVKALKGKIKTIICPLGVGAHFEHWGFDTSKLIEKDWYEQVDLAAGFQLTLEPARHFSGRTFKRNTSLWTSYVLQTPSFKIFIGGDSGYDDHFASIGKKHGPFDLAILENGQYDKSWRYIHLLPEEQMQAASDLKARRLLPVHSSKFMLGNHSWKDPLQSISDNSRGHDVSLITPMIGEIVQLNDDKQVFEKWWEKID